MRPRKAPVWLLLFGLTWLQSTFLAVQPTYADPEKRVALLIGNSDYGNGQSVSGREDAAAIKDKLGFIGFTDVVMVPDASLQQMTDELKRFKARMKDASMVVFFYSGHGFHRGEQSYLLPVDGSILPDRSLPLKTVLRSLAYAPKDAVKLVILNACRTEIDLADDQQGPGKPERGLAMPQKTPWRVVQAFATSPGLEANSGKDGALSPYPKALLAHFFEPGINLYQLFSAVREDVILATSNSGDQNFQFPVAYGLEDPEGSFVLSPPAHVEASVELADDDLIVFLNGKLALNHQTQGVVAKKDFLQKNLTLKSGANDLTVLVSNQKTLRHGLPWERTDGWGYKLRLIGPDGPLISPECGGQDSCLSGGEEIPFKDGPHHGKTFVVATATIFVDPSSGMSPRVSLKDVKTDLWKNNEIPFWAKDQDLLYAVSLTKLPLGVAVAGNLQEIFDMIVKNVLKVQKNVPDPNKIYNVVRGNAALQEFVAPCIEGPGYCDERMKDFKQSLDAARKGDPKPFDGFVERLTECIRDRAAQKPGFTIPREDIQVWTAFEDWTSEERQPPNPGFSGGQACRLDPAKPKDALFQVPAHGLRIGPQSFSESLRGVPFALRASAFINVQPAEKDRFLLSARIVTDLSDLQSKVSAIIDTIPLPSDNCARFAPDNLVPRISGKQITAEGEVATLRLDGDLDVWQCAKNPAYPVCKIFGCGKEMKNKVEATFEVQIPVHFVVASNTAAFAVGDPQVRIRGKGDVGKLVEGLLRAVGVDIEGKVKAALKRAIEPDKLKVPLPAELQRLGPTFTQAGFFNNAGALATSLEMTATVDGRSLLGLLEILRPAGVGSS